MAWIPKKCVIVPIDFSEQSLAAVHTAMELVATPHDVHVIHVLMGGSDRDLLREWAPRATDDSYLTAGQRRMAEFLKAHSISDVVQEVCLGNPGLAIADYARKLHAELIVIASHGYGGAARFLLGSVADRVIRCAPCPVLVLRRDETH